MITTTRIICECSQRHDNWANFRTQSTQESLTTLMRYILIIFLRRYRYRKKTQRYSKSVLRAARRAWKDLLSGMFVNSRVVDLGPKAYAIFGNRARVGVINVIHPIIATCISNNRMELRAIAVDI